MYAFTSVSSGPKSVTLPSGERLPYSIDRREVEHPRITLNPDGTLAVIVPPDTPGHTLVAREEDWIAEEYHEQQAKLLAIREQYEVLEEEFTIWGKSYSLIERTGQYDLSIDAATLRVTSPESKSTEQYLYNKLRQALSVAIKAIASDFCEQINVTYSKLSIRSQRTKWASCSNGDTLNFNLRCAFLPIGHLRYLVAHEVSHLREPDHTEAFWELVDTLVPRYQTYRDELQGFWYAVHHNRQWQRLLSQGPV